MYQSHRPLEQQRPKRGEKQKRKETSQPHPKEREKNDRKQKRQPLENLDTTYNVSRDKMAYSNAEGSKARAQSDEPIADVEESRKDFWPQGPSPDLRLDVIVRDSMLRRVKSIEKRAKAEKEARKNKPLPAIPEAERTASPTKVVSGLERIPPWPRSEDIPANQHSLRQHPARNVDGNTLIYAPPTGSTAASDITPRALKEEDLPVLGVKKMKAKPPEFDRNCLYPNLTLLKGKRKQPAGSHSVKNLSSADRNHEKRKVKQRAGSCPASEASDTGRSSSTLVEERPKSSAPKAWSSLVRKVRSFTDGVS